MKTSNQPRRLQDSFGWIESLNGQHRLYLLVDTDPSSVTFKHSMKAGKESTLMQFKSERGNPDAWVIKSYYSAKAWLAMQEKPSDVSRETNPAEKDQPVPIIDTTTDDNVPPVAESIKAGLDTLQQRKVVYGQEASIAGANAIAGLVHAAIAQAIDAEAIRKSANEQVAEAVRNIVTPTIISVQMGDDAPVIPIGTAHKNFPRLLQMANSRGNDGHRLNILMHGPAGTSKTHSAKQVAKAMNLPFYPFSAINDEYKLSGFRDANGDVVRTLFRELVEFGGVGLFDELSASDENAFLSLNAFLANGVFAFPDAVIERHKDCVILAGDNVLGGATADYNARNKMDDSSMDRFVTIQWPIDAVLERTITGDDEWTSLVQSARVTAESMGLKILITPRASLNGAALLRSGMSKYQAAEATMRRSLDDAQWSKLCSKIGLQQE